MARSDTPTPPVVERSQTDTFVTYLDKEMSFQAAISAVCGGVALWILNTLLFFDPNKQPSVLKAPISIAGNLISPGSVAKVAALAFATASLLFLFQRGQFSIKLGRLARSRATNERIDVALLDDMVRSVGDVQVVRRLWQYYLGRACLLVGIVAVLVLAFAL
jgi:hypothetical protein